MKKARLYTCAFLFLGLIPLQAQQDYKASLFGIRSDGQTLNTASIQKAIDYISENGGGRLLFYVGRYLTGTIRLKSNVTIHLFEGAGLIASTNPYDYPVDDHSALIVAAHQDHTGITGMGYIEGQGALLSTHIDEQGFMGYLPGGIKTFRPSLINLHGCTDVTLSGIILFNAAGAAKVITGCEQVHLANVTELNRAAPPVKEAGVSKRNGVQNEYDVTLFGVQADGLTVSTTAIQRAIDVAHERGGGRVVFPAGKYVSGSLYLKSGVTLHLEKGAVLAGSLNPFDYGCVVYTAFIMANKHDHLGITGEGLIDGRGREVANRIVDLVHRGIVEDPLSNDRPRETIRPMVIAFHSCTDILIEDIHIANSASWVQTYEQCKNLTVHRIHVHSNAYWNNDGIDIVDCEEVRVTHSFFDVADDAICLKSHNRNFLCKNILIRNNVARSGANGIKFGTASFGGFVNIQVLNNKVYDTFRSAFTIGAVDGAVVDNIVVDSLEAIHTGNVIYLRLGDRRSEGRMAVMKNITISNVYAEVPEEKPDAGYEYEGPIEDLPRNVSPSSIAGLPNHYITGVKLKNITIVYPGGGDPRYASCAATPQGLASIPEMEHAYPEFSQFKELPAWAFFVRHAQNIEFENVIVTAKKPDYRPAVVLDDVHGVSFKSVTFTEPEANRKKQVYSHRASEVRGK